MSAKQYQRQEQQRGREDKQRQRDQGLRDQQERQHEDARKQQRDQFDRLRRNRREDTGRDPGSWRGVSSTVWLLGGIGALGFAGLVAYAFYRA